MIGYEQSLLPVSYVQRQEAMPSRRLMADGASVRLAFLAFFVTVCGNFANESVFARANLFCPGCGRISSNLLSAVEL
jgi:hypothetical protein